MSDANIEALSNNSVYLSDLNMDVPEFKLFLSSLNEFMAETHGNKYNPSMLYNKAGILAQKAFSLKNKVQPDLESFLQETSAVSDLPMAIVVAALYNVFDYANPSTYEKVCKMLFSKEAPIRPFLRRFNDQIKRSSTLDFNYSVGVCSNKEELLSNFRDIVWNTGNCLEFGNMLVYKRQFQKGFNTDEIFSGFDISDKKAETYSQRGVNLKLSLHFSNIATDDLIPALYNRKQLILLTDDPSLPEKSWIPQIISNYARINEEFKKRSVFNPSFAVVIVNTPIISADNIKKIKKSFCDMYTFGAGFDVSQFITDEFKGARSYGDLWKFVRPRILEPVIVDDNREIKPLLDKEDVEEGMFRVGARTDSINSLLLYYGAWIMDNELFDPAQYVNYW